MCVFEDMRPDAQFSNNNCFNALFFFLYPFCVWSLVRLFCLFWVTVIMNVLLYCCCVVVFFVFYCVCVKSTKSNVQPFIIDTTSILPFPSFHYYRSGSQVVTLSASDTAGQGSITDTGRVIPKTIKTWGYLNEGTLSTIRQYTYNLTRRVLVIFSYCRPPDEPALKLPIFSLNFKLDPKSETHCPTTKLPDK